MKNLRKKIKERARRILRAIENRFPRLGELIIQTYIYCRFYLFYKPVIFLNSFRKTTEDPSKVYYVDPLAIKYQLSDSGRRLVEGKGHVAGGDWDTHVVELEGAAGHADAKKDQGENVAEISICIDRKGGPVLYEGDESLLAAKAQSAKKIPVKVVVRHKEWADFKREIKDYTLRIRGKLYQPAYHFDLEDLPYMFGERRIGPVINSTHSSEGSVLDIGACFGYFCHKFEEAGFECTAIERNPSNVYFMEKLRDANDDNFKVVRESIFDFRKGEKLEYDVVLALYIFHHFIKTEKLHKELVELLGRIDCKEMFLGTHNPNEGQMQGIYRNYQPDEFANLVVENSNLNHYELVKEFKEEKGRRLYRIYK